MGIYQNQAEKEMVASSDCRKIEKGLSYRYDYAHIAGSDLHLYLCPAPWLFKKRIDFLPATESQKTI